MLDRIRKAWRNAATPLKNLWSWAKRPKAEGQAKRFKALSDWARKKWREAKNAEAKAAWAVRKRVYRKRYRAARERAERTGVAVWEPWMANGRNPNVTNAVKQEVAIAVVKFDCYVTSLYRATVIPQSNPNSYHGPNVSPGRAGDVAGARMADYQADCYQRRKGDPGLLELYGPINDKGLKNGAHVTLGEGTFLENLHDSHTHVAAA